MCGNRGGPRVILTRWWVRRSSADNLCLFRSWYDLRRHRSVFVAWVSGRFLLPSGFTQSEKYASRRHAFCGGFASHRHRDEGDELCRPQALTVAWTSHGVTAGGGARVDDTRRDYAASANRRHRHGLGTVSDCCKGRAPASSNHPRLRRGPLRRRKEMGTMVAAYDHSGREAVSRGARMLRTALGPAIARYLEDPSIVEVTLNPDDGSGSIASRKASSPRTTC